MPNPNKFDMIRLESFQNATGDDTFPLQLGSSGSNVNDIQNALNNIVPNENLTVSGVFDGATQTALSDAGYAYDSVDQATYNKILADSDKIMSGQMAPVPVPVSSPAYKANPTASTKTGNSLLDSLLGEAVKVANPSASKQGKVPATPVVAPKKPTSTSPVVYIIAALAIGGVIFAAVHFSKKGKGTPAVTNTAVPA